MDFQPNQIGYYMFTEYIHKNDITGVIHGIGTPIAGMFIFNLLYIIVNIFTKDAYHTEYILKNIMYFILGFFSCGYLTYDFSWGLVTIMFYWYIFNVTINRLVFYNLKFTFSNIYKIILGITIPISVMEFVGHWYLENSGSDINMLANSIYHTPLYGVKSLLLFFK